MNLILDPDNPLTDSNALNQGELHMQAGDAVTIIDPEGNEIYVFARLANGTLVIQRDADESG